MGALFLVLFITGRNAQSAETTTWQPGIVEIIDIPTADLVDHYGYNVSFRFFKEGGIQTKILFGVFPRLNLGFGMDAERVIGVGDSRLNKPTINVKLRIFDGQRAIPAIAIGFDGQGYNFNRTLDEYEQQEKGLFAVATKEIMVPNFVVSLGVNHFDFDKGDTTRGFLGATYIYEQIVGIFFEYDSFTNYDGRRINFGARYFVTPVFTVDAIGRNVPIGTLRADRETERVLRLGYTGSF